ncbi:MAG TPA: response regulator [Janthinobacterium sp.]|nr:response regulator [Janthinobacterium sp.]
MSGAASGRAGLRVLVVDDDSFMREFIIDLLQDLGLSGVASAADGEQAIASFSAATLKPRPDLIVADLQMPGQDGSQLLAALAEQRYDGALILLSGQEDRILNSAMLMARFHQLQVLAALPKPPDPASLARAIAMLE